MSEMEFAGQVAVVTGAAMGIGRACAEKLAAGGARVVVADIDEQAGRQAAEAIAQAGGEALFAATDVADTASVEAMAAAALDAYGSIDILVNNAARAIGGVVDETDERTWQEVINTNLTGVWRGMKACVPAMRAKGAGAIVNMSSVQALAGFKGWAAYASAKGAINALTIQSAVDLAPVGIRVNAVAPGTIMTPLNEKVFAEAADPQALRETWNKAHPLGRFGEAHEVAELVAFLASKRAAFITGTIVRVDGGLAIRGE